MIPNIKILPSGVDTEKFHQVNKQEALNYIESRFNINLNAKIKLIFVGRISREKGLSYLIDALRLLDDVELLVVGTGPEEAYMKKHSSGLGGKIHFLGAVEKDNVPLVLNAADIFVLPSLSEGFSNSLLEAMACNLPSVATNVGAAKEVVTHKVGKAVEPGNAEQIAGAVKAIRENYTEYTPRAIAEEKYSFHKAAQVVYDAYSEVCEKDVENICFASFMAPPYFLAGIQPFELARELAKRCRVTVLTSNIMNAPSYEKADNVNLWRVRHVNVLTGRPFYSIAATLRGLRMPKFDVVDGRNWEGALVAVLLKKVKGNKAVVRFVGKGAFEGPGVKGIANRYVIANADLIIATDEETANEAKKLASPSTKAG
jgi:hypothetical protein